MTARGFDGTPGPWFPAIYPGECMRCGERFAAHDQIRADGQGSYECCVEDGTEGAAERRYPFSGTSLDDMGY